MIADMMRVVAGLAAWVAGTVIAVLVASFGANVVALEPAELQEAVIARLKGALA